MANGKKLQATLGLDMSPYKQSIEDAKKLASGLKDQLNTAFKNGAVQDYADRLNGLRTQVRTLGNEYKALSLSDASAADQTAKLTQQIEAQRRVVDSTNQKLQETIQKYGEMSNKSLFAQSKLAQEQKVLASLGNQLRQLSTASDDASKSSERLNQSFSSQIGYALKNTAIYGGMYYAINAVTSSIKNALSAGIDFDSQMQQAQIGFTTLLGSASQAKKMLNDLADFARNTPFDLTGVEDSAKQMLAMGFTAKEILPDMKAIGDAAAALGLQTDGIQRISLALAQLKTHGVVDAQDLLQLTEAGIPAWEILSQAMGKPIPVLQKMVSQGIVPADKAVQDLLDGMEQKYPNMLEKMNSSFSSEMGNLKDNLKQTLGDLEQGAFNDLTNKILPDLNTKMDIFRQTLEATGSASQAFKSIIPPDIVNTVQTALSATKGLLLTLYNLRDALIPIATGFAALKIGTMFNAGTASVLKLITAFTALNDAEQTLKKTQMALNLAMEANPIGLIVAALGLAAGAFIMFRQQEDSAAQSASKLSEELAKVNQEIEQQKTDAQSAISDTTNHINQLQQLKLQYESLANTLAKTKAGTDAYKKAQADLIDIKQQMIGIIGDEATKQIMSSKDVIKAWNDEIKQMLQTQIAEMTATNNRLKSEQTLTDGVISETNKRIEAMQNEMDAIQKTSDIRGYRGQFAYDMQSIHPLTGDQNNTDALSQQQEDAWRSSLGYKNYVQQNSKGPLDDSIAQAKAMLQELQKNNNAMFGTGSGSGSGGGNLGSAANQAGKNLVQAFINGIDSQLAPLQDTMSQLQARLQFRQDQGNTDAVKSTINEMVKGYQTGMNQLQKAMDAISAKMKSMNPKTQGADIASLRNEWSKLAVEWWKDRDAIQQLNNQLQQTAIEAAQKAADAFKTMAQDQLQSFEDAKNAELATMQKIHQQALANFDSETQAMLAGIDAQIAALDQVQQAQDRQKQEQTWSGQESDLNHRLAVAQMMGDPATIKQVQQQIADLHDQEQSQRDQWARDDQKAALEQQKQNLQAQRDAQKAAMQQMFQDQETAFQQQIQQQQQQLTALIQGLVQAITDRKITQDQANAAWVQAIKDNGDDQVTAQIAGQKKVTDALNKWIQSYIDLGKSYGKSLGDGVVAGLQSMLGSVQAAAAQLRSAAAGAMSLVSGSISASGSVAFKIPALATGGIVSSPTLALIGERGPEAVVPLNKQSQFGGNTIYAPITVQGPVYGVDDLQRAIADGFDKVIGDAVVRQRKG